MDQIPNNIKKEETLNNNGEMYERESDLDVARRMLQDRAPEQAKELVAQIVGYEQLSAAERVTTLQALMTELATDNDNRFVVEELAKLAQAEEAMAVYEQIKSSGKIPMGTLKGKWA